MKHQFHFTITEDDVTSLKRHINETRANKVLFSADSNGLRCWVFVCTYFIILNLCQKEVLKINLKTFMLKLKVEVKFSLQQATKTQRGSRCIPLLFLQPRRYIGWVVNVTPRPLYPPGKNRYPLYRRLGGHPGPVWTGAKNLAPTGIWCPDRPAHSESLYRLSYTGNSKVKVK